MVGPIIHTVKENTGYVYTYDMQLVVEQSRRTLQS
jgi:hypothetical protein